MRYYGGRTGRCKLYTPNSTTLQELIDMEAAGAKARKKARKRTKTGSHAERATEWAGPALEVLRVSVGKCGINK